MEKYQDKEYLLSLGTIDPELDALLKANPPPPADYSDLGFFKKMVEQRNDMALEALGKPPPEVKQTELHFTARDGTSIRAKLFQPEPLPKDGAPLCVMYHGGGFCVGAPESEEQSCRNFVLALGAICVAPAYRLGPEFKFPTQPDDAWDALKWAASNAKSWGADLSKGFVVGGTSAGGNMSAVLATLARDEGLSPPLTGQMLVIPATVAEERVPEKWKQWYLSMEQMKDAPVLPKAAINMFMRGYQPDLDSPKYNVIGNPKGHANLPPAVFMIDGMDPLRDEGFIYERILRENGTKTQVYVYPGQPHGHFAFFPSLKASDKFRREQIEAMGWLLGRTPDMSKAWTDAKIASA